MMNDRLEANTYIYIYVYTYIHMYIYYTEHINEIPKCVLYLKSVTRDEWNSRKSFYEFI